MQKAQASAALGQRRLLLPGWVKAALCANERLKLYLTVLQTAWMHAAQPNGDPPDLAKEIAAAGLNARWLGDVLPAARRVDGDLRIPELPRIVKCRRDDLATMARPVLESLTANTGPQRAPLPSAHGQSSASIRGPANRRGRTQHHGW